MIRITPQDATSRSAIERLRGWDFRMDADKVEPLLFTAWLRDFARQVFFRHLGAAAADYWNLKPQVIAAVLSDHPEWCARPAEKAKSCKPLLEATLATAVAELRNEYGPDIDTWRWGRVHIAEFPSRFWEQVPLLRDWLRIGVPAGGGFDTVNRGSTTIREPAHPFVQRFGAGLRIITDLAAPEDSRMIAAPGQSGNPLSAHFSDLVERWRQFDYLVPGRAKPVATLTLEPAR
jgi:penicillin amidase